MNASKSILFSNNEMWVKKSGLFDVTMGSYHGAEICELVGLYLLNSIKNKFPTFNVGLYRDDGLGCHNLSKQKAEKLKKELQKIFKENNLKITVEPYLEYVNFLDVSLDMDNDSFGPYRKPNDTPIYINKHSNHPPSIIKKLPRMIQDRLSSISSSRESFEQSKEQYQEALNKSGYTETLEFKPHPKKTRTRKRNILWYNPPWNAAITSNFGKQFLMLLDKCFPAKHKLRKIINRNTIKIGYSCTPNYETIRKSHNRTVLRKNNKEQETKLCNCRNKQACPLQGKCLTESIVYQATVITENKESAIYYGSTEGPFKTRYNGHMSNFRSENTKNATALSTFIHNEKENGKEVKVNWSIKKKSNKYMTGSRICQLCLSEKLTILLSKERNMINHRTELMAKCKHSTKHKLKCIKRNT